MGKTLKKKRKNAYKVFTVLNTKVPRNWSRNGYFADAPNVLTLD